jgi:hypothetical protein
MKPVNPITISSQDPDQTLVCLKKNVLYVALVEDDEKTILGKVISINDKKSFKPNGNTAALLLYLLVCDDDEPILLSELIDYCMQKFTGVTPTDVTTFLNKLDKTHKILKIRTGSSGTNDPDPLNKFTTSPQISWGSPDLNPDGEEPICKANTFYSHGYWPVIIPK